MVLLEPLSELLFALAEPFPADACARVGSCSEAVARPAAALTAMVWAWVRLRGDDLTQAQFATVQVFWYFVVLVWPVLYWKVYL